MCSGLLCSFMLNFYFSPDRYIPPVLTNLKDFFGLVIVFLQYKSVQVIVDDEVNKAN